MDNKKVANLDGFIEVMKSIPDRARIVVTYRHLRDLHTMHTSILHIDRHWTSKMRMAIRNDSTGLWDYQDISDALPPQPVLPKKAQFIRLDHVGQPCATELVRSFVRISCAMPLKLDGFPKARKVSWTNTIFFNQLMMENNSRVSVSLLMQRRVS